MFGTQWQATAVLETIASRVMYCDAAVGVGSHITGLFSVHRELLNIRVLPVETVDDYVDRVVHPCRALVRGVDILHAFVSRDDVAVVWW
jgi:hypothetical protein